ncbi:hypothetical protein G7Y89_g9563 [Cudoniella acicularis]|uniref:Uncharacterized protein n=1 Tax=Cudoniella acicularis TaxID=354080 RepID=A0A8H4REF4_9HELO|nr:hypothetical protein G7Y89_g9563 [Cudoniella acicularis]
MIHNAIIDTTIWDYICHLIQLLVDSANAQIYSTIILQELSNVCQLEYRWVQQVFKRHVQTGSGSKCFKRIEGIYDNGIARVSLKGKPELLTRENPQVHYMLRLCQAETDASSTITWIKKLDDFHRAHPSEREEMQEREYESFGDLAKWTNFVSGSKQLATELDPLKQEVDLTNFAIPIDNLKEPGMADGALNTLDQFIVDKTGAKMGSLYQDFIESCITNLQERFQQQKAKSEKHAATPLPAIIKTPSLEVRVQQRRQKEKTRPAHLCIYDIAPTAKVLPRPETMEKALVFKAKQDIFDTFSTLFSKSDSRGSISWVAFEAAMADLKFSVMPKFGSVFIFFPPKDMGVDSSTVHRPHMSRIEGHLLLSFASRLKRAYGWGENSFEVA